MMSVYEFLTGPLMWITLVAFVAGIIYKTLRLVKIMSQGYASGAVFLNPNARFARSFKSSLPGRHPFITLVSVVFHLILFMAPVFLKGHNLFLDQSFGFSLPMIPDTICDNLTIICLCCCLVFLLRRILVRRVRAISSFQDYLILFLVTMPFLTGFILYHKFLSYEAMLNLHIISGQLMLVAIPFTRLIHMVVFFVLRFPFPQAVAPRNGAAERAVL